MNPTLQEGVFCDRREAESLPTTFDDLNGVQGHSGEVAWGWLRRAQASFR